ncbi:peptidylprolyl isomerase, partial [Terrisporobacter glycolicus]|uniref:peptidylprolyl isomerase n=1 Tax=Terrisporobacter glycolicus TaxID=36841 RepID=UPI003464B6D3
MKKIALMGLTILISINMVACGNKNVAKVNDVDISKDNYKKIEELLCVTGYIEKKDKNSDEINNDVLSFIIDNEVAYQDAQKQNIKVEDSEVNEKFEQLKETLNTNPLYKEKLEASGVTEDFLKEQIKKDLIVAKYKENFIKDIKVSDKEMEAYYNNHKDQFNVEEVKASQILISTLDKDNKEVSKEEKEKLKEKAQNVLDKIKNNEDFATLAKEYSDDKNS